MILHAYILYFTQICKLFCSVLYYGGYTTSGPTFSNTD